MDIHSIQIQMRREQSLPFKTFKDMDPAAIATGSANKRICKVAQKASKGSTQNLVALLQVITSISVVNKCTSKISKSNNHNHSFTSYLSPTPSYSLLPRYCFHTQRSATLLVIQNMRIVQRPLDIILIFVIFQESPCLLFAKVPYVTATFASDLRYSEHKELGRGICRGVSEAYRLHVCNIRRE